jgi:hypothetical protein
LGPQKALLKEMSVRARALGRPLATKKIVEDLANMAEAAYDRVNFLKKDAQPVFA